MLIAYSYNNIPIRLTDERWKHIISRHPEMSDQQDKILKTITEPDMIQKGDADELIGIRLYPKTPLTRKFLVVVYREINELDGFILTAYFSNYPSTKRVVIWKR